MPDVVLDDLKKFIRMHSSPRAEFIREIGLSKSESVATIIQAHVDIKNAFRGIYRKSKLPFFRHPIAVVLIRVWSGEPYTADDIVASLHHDTPETFPDVWTFPYLQLCTNETVVQLVKPLTKLPLERFDNSRTERDKAYYAGVKQASHRSVLIKLADVLHNQMTLEYMSLETQRRKVEEAKSVYIPLAMEHEFLYDEIEFVVTENELSLLTN